MEDLIIRNKEAELPARPVILQCVAALPGGAVLDLSGVELSEDVKVLYAGHPVALNDDGKWQPCSLTDGDYEEGYAGFPDPTSPYNGFGVLMHDVPVDNPVADIMLIGVVDVCAMKAPLIKGWVSKKAQENNHIVFINMPTE